MNEPEVLFEARGRAGLITLNRPAALNALTLNMVREMQRMLDQWAIDPAVERVVISGAGEKAFCAGGDIRALYDWGRSADRRFLDFYREEYLLNITIKRFPKPYIAIMDGITMGGGVGVSVHGSHRIATDRLTFAMPETGIGLFPDVGGTYFLPRCPGETGLYIGLTGARIKSADAIYAGIADLHVTTENLDAVLGALAEEPDVDVALGRFAQAPVRSPLEAIRDTIDRHFEGSSVDEILESLDRDGSDWAVRTAGIIRSKSPTSLRICFRQLRAGAKLSFEDCMDLEFKIVNRIMTGHDFFEGTRAVVIDKDQQPRWEPSTLDSVGDEVVDAYFAPLVDALRPRHSDAPQDAAASH